MTTMINAENQEIERKFTVRNDSYKESATESYRIAQGYLCTRKSTARIRIKDNTAYLTIKGKSKDGGLSRFEWEREIPIKCASWLLGRCKGSVIDKTRYIVPIGQYTWEIDEFHGDNKGLTIAEVELSSRDERPELPDWVASEVTGIKLYHNSFISKCPYKEWAKLFRK